MIYELKIEGLEFRAAHGCYDVEQRVGGNFTVDITLEVDDAGAAAADDVTRTVNYVEVYETIRQQMATPSRIIENTAQRILDAVAARFPQVARAVVTVAKLAPPIGGKATRVAVTLYHPS
jgi:dihydroneopterin aldolase